VSRLLCDYALLTEVAGILEQHAEVRCEPTVDLEEDSGDLVLTVRVHAFDLPDEQRLGLLELLTDLQYLQDLCSMRAFARRYDIDPARLEALLPKGEK
jgi:hypothetical protein